MLRALLPVPALVYGSVDSRTTWPSKNAQLNMPSFVPFVAFPCRPLMRALSPVEPAMLFQLYVFPSNAITNCDGLRTSVIDRAYRPSFRNASDSPAVLALYQANGASLLLPGMAELLAVDPSWVIEFRAYQVATPSFAVG